MKVAAVETVDAKRNRRMGVSGLENGNQKREGGDEVAVTWRGVM